MSEPDHATQPPRDGCLTFFLVLIGIVMLLPGVCSVLLGVALRGNWPRGMDTLFLIMSVAAGAQRRRP